MLLCQPPTSRLVQFIRPQLPTMLWLCQSWLMTATSIGKWVNYMLPDTPAGTDSREILLRIPDQFKIPTRVRGLTGIPMVMTMPQEGIVRNVRAAGKGRPVEAPAGVALLAEVATPIAAVAPLLENFPERGKCPLRHRDENPPAALLRNVASSVKPEGISMRTAEN